jgi:pyridoxamine 5'-phosphate oxidase
VIGGSGELGARLAEVEARFAGSEPTRPPQWGGYLVRPNVIEFWQGGPNRLHDRLRYARDADRWHLERLSP